MPTLIKKTSTIPSASSAVMGAAILKQQGKTLAGSLSLFGGKATKTGGKVVGASSSAFAGSLLRSGGKSLAASMLPFSAPKIVGDNIYWNGPFALNSGFSQSFTVAAIPYPCLVVDVMMDASLALTSCTYGGVTVPMVQIGTNTSGATTLILWQGVLPNCPTGANTLSIGLSSSDISTFGVRSYGGVDPVTPVNSKSVSSGGSASTTVTVRPGGWIVDGAIASGALTNFTGPTSPQEQDALSAGALAAGISHNGPLSSGSVSDGWNLIGGSASGLVGAIALNPASSYIFLKQTRKSIAGSASIFSGTINRSCAQAFSAAMAVFAGAETVSILKGVAASMNPFGGSMNRSSELGIAGSMSGFAGAGTKQTDKGIAASMSTFSVFIQTLRVFLMSFGASMSTFAGAAQKQIQKSIPASMQQFGATLFKRTAQAIAASMQTWTVAFRNGSQVFFVSINGAMAAMGAAVTKSLDRAIAAAMEDFDGSTSYSRPTFCPPNYLVDAQGLVFAVVGGDILSTPSDAQETDFPVGYGNNTLSTPGQTLTFGVRYKKKGPCCP